MCECVFLKFKEVINCLWVLHSSNIVFEVGDTKLVEITIHSTSFRSDEQEHFDLVFELLFALPSNNSLHKYKAC